MFNLEILEKLCVDLARKTKSRNLDPVHVEYVLATQPEFHTVFSTLADEATYNQLISEIRKHIDGCEKITPAFVAAHGTEYPVRTTQGYFMLKEDIAKIAKILLLDPSGHMYLLQLQNLLEAMLHTAA